VVEEGALAIDEEGVVETGVISAEGPKEDLVIVVSPSVPMVQMEKAVEPEAVE